MPFKSASFPSTPASAFRAPPAPARTSARREFVTSIVGGGALLGAAGLSASASAQTAPDAAAATHRGARAAPLPYVKFSAANCCLLMVDYQMQIAKVAPSQPIEDVLGSALSMLALAKALDIPVIFTSSEEEKPRKGLFFPELTKVLPQAYERRIRRTGLVDAFDDQGVVAAVRATGRRNLVLGGISTEECVSLPALSAINAGYNVKVIADACSSHSAFTDNIQFTRMQAYGVDVTTVRQFVADMLVDWSSAQTSNYLKVLKEAQPSA